MSYDSWKATDPFDAGHCGQCGNDVPGACDCAADDERWPRALREAEQRCERVERERDEAVALLERVCDGDYCARERAIHEARKYLSGLKDVQF